MAPVVVDPNKVREFESFEQFYDWLSNHHDTADEIWIKTHKVSSGLKSITWKEAIDAALCWGWIDGIRKSFDDKSFLQRYTKRGKKSVWSEINVQNVERLVKAGVMTEFGMVHVDAAKADGRWDRAYGAGKNLKIPDDLQVAIYANPKAKAMLEKLNEQNRFALAFRCHNLKTPAGRAKHIAAAVAMLECGETIYPQGKKV